MQESPRLSLSKSTFGEAGGEVMKKQEMELGVEHTQNRIKTENHPLK